jgi:hypothetical protein
VNLSGILAQRGVAERRQGVDETLGRQLTGHRQPSRTRCGARRRSASWRRTPRRGTPPSTAPRTPTATGASSRSAAVGVYPDHRRGARAGEPLRRPARELARREPAGVRWARRSRVILGISADPMITLRASACVCTLVAAACRHSACATPLTTVRAPASLVLRDIRGRPPALSTPPCRAHRFTVVTFFSEPLPVPARARRPHPRPPREGGSRSGSASSWSRRRRARRSSKPRRPSRSERGYPIVVDDAGRLARAVDAEYATYSVVRRRGTPRCAYRGGFDSDRSHLSDDRTCSTSPKRSTTSLAGRPVRHAGDEARSGARWRCGEEAAFSSSGFGLTGVTPAPGPAGTTGSRVGRCDHHAGHRRCRGSPAFCRLPFVPRASRVAFVFAARASSTSVDIGFGFLRGVSWSAATAPAASC